MQTFLDLQFRPTLIIFVGEGGALVREYLSPHYGEVLRQSGGVGNRINVALSRHHLLSNLDTPLHNSVALIQVVSEGPGANPQVAIPFPTLKAFPNDPDVPTKQGDLELIIECALRSIQMDRHMIAMRSQGYKVSNTRSQVFIVGEPTPTYNPPLGGPPPYSNNKIWMKNLMGIVREQFRKHKFEVPIFYFLNAYGPSADFRATLQKAGPLTWQDYHIANLSLVYEYQIPIPMPTFVNEDELRYATAQALLGLMATGITSSSLFETEMRMPTNLVDYANQIGNFSTGMIMFPRPITRRYCGSQLSADLIEKMHQDMKKARVANEVRRRALRDGLVLAENIKAWIADSDPRPAAEESLWPSFRILRANPTTHPESEEVGYKQRDLFQQLVLLTGKLFSTFSSENITEEFEQFPDKSKTWVSLAYERCHKAEGIFGTWRLQANKVWDALQDRTGIEIRHQVETRCFHDKSGFEVARVFVDQLDDQLYELHEQVEKWRRNHDEAYRGDRQHYEALADGDWAIKDNESNVKGAAQQADQATPVMNHIVVGGPGMPAEPQYLPEEEAKVARALRSRAEWKQKQVPAPATLVSSALLGYASLALMLSLFGIPVLGQVVADMVLLAAFGIGNFLFHRGRQQQSNQAHEEMLGFYRRYFIYKCESHEDFKRFGLIRNWRGRVGRMRSRLDNMSALFTTLEEGLENHAGELNFELFHGPAFERDVFVANGERLVETGSHTLNSIHAKIEQTRKNKPRQAWHSTLDTIRDALIAHVRQEQLSLLEIKEDKLQEILINFCAEIVDDYLVGSLVEISPSLNKADIWRDVLAHVGRPLYAANMGKLVPDYTFVCGNPQALSSCARYIPNDAIQVQTKSSEWVMLAAYFRGGDPDMVDADNLFPPK